MRQGIWAIATAVLLGVCTQTPPERQLINDAAAALGDRVSMQFPWADNFLANLKLRNLRVERSVPTHGATQTFAEVLETIRIASMERVKQLGPWDTVLAPHGFLMPIDLPLSPREIFLAGQPKPATPPTAHPAVIGAGRVNAYLDGMMRAGRQRLAAEQATPSR